MVLVNNMQMEEMIRFLEKLIEVCEAHEYSNTIELRRRANLLLKQLKLKKPGRYEMFT